MHQDIGVVSNENNLSEFNLTSLVSNSNEVIGWRSNSLLDTTSSTCLSSLPFADRSVPSLIQINPSTVPEPFRDPSILVPDSSLLVVDRLSWLSNLIVKYPFIENFLGFFNSANFHTFSNLLMTTNNIYIFCGLASSLLSSYNLTFYNKIPQETIKLLSFLDT